MILERLICNLDTLDVEVNLDDISDSDSDCSVEEEDDDIIDNFRNQIIDAQAQLDDNQNPPDADEDEVPADPLGLEDDGIIAGHEEDEPIFHRAPKQIKSLEESQNPIYYDPFPPVNTNVNYVASISKKDKIFTSWSLKRQSNPQGRRPAQDILRSDLKVKPPYKNLGSILECFKTFIHQEVVDIILLRTNERMVRTRARLNPQTLLSSKNAYLQADFTESEFWALMGLVIARGRLGWNHENVSNIWTSQFSNPIFSATMSINRFRFLIQMMSFDDKATRAERKKRDLFAPIREVFELIVGKFPSVLTCDQWTTIDECLYPTRANVSYKKYLPDKPKPYGINFQCLNSVRIPYVYAMRVCAGNPENPDQYKKTGN